MMNSLTELYQADVATKQAQDAAYQAKLAQDRADLMAGTLDHFRMFFARWEPLQALLGLKGRATMDTEGGIIEWVGASAVNGLAVATTAFMYRKDGPLSQPSLYLRMSDNLDERVTVYGEIDAGWSADEVPAAYAAVMTRMCAQLMEIAESTRARDVEDEANRLNRLAAARRYIALARTYEERGRWVAEKQEAWAIEWAAKTWEPHKLWKVCYVPVGALVEEDQESVTIVVMEEPGDIIMALRQFPTATVSAIGLGGDVTEVEIPSFLNAQVLIFAEPTITEPLPYHCRYIGGRFTVNVPPYSGSRPAPAPELISWRSYLKECDVPDWVGELEAATIAALTPEEFVEE